MTVLSVLEGNGIVNLWQSLLSMEVLFCPKKASNSNSVAMQGIFAHTPTEDEF